MALVQPALTVMLTLTAQLALTAKMLLTMQLALAAKMSQMANMISWGTSLLAPLLLVLPLLLAPSSQHHCLGRRPYGQRCSIITSASACGLQNNTAVCPNLEDEC